jgi:soluble lytic murein transglycosylase-like protein
MIAALAVIAAAIGAGAFFLMRKRASAVAAVLPPDAGKPAPASAPKSRMLDEIFADYGAKFGVDPLLLKAIAMAESSLNPRALRNNPPRDVSAGLMQVLCIPDANGYCTNAPDIPPADYDADAWASMSLEQMYDPEVSAYWGALILASYIRDFGFPRGVARYNMRRAKDAPLNGPFPNQVYVNKVLSNYRKLQEAL